MTVDSNTVTFRLNCRVFYTQRSEHTSTQLTLVCWKYF